MLFMRRAHLNLTELQHYMLAHCTHTNTHHKTRTACIIDCMWHGDAFLLFWTGARKFRVSSKTISVNSKKIPDWSRLFAIVINSD